MVAQGAHAADLAREHIGGAAHVAQRIEHRAAQHRVVVVLLEGARLLALQQVTRDGHALARKGQHVGTQVHLQGLRVDAQRVVFVGAIGQQRLGAARRDPGEFEFFLLRRQGTVGVLDGPIVIGAQGVVEGGALGLARDAGRGQVDRRVLHHRTGQAVGGREHRVAQLLFAVNARGAEVVAQPERVAHLVHGGVLEVVVDELLGFRAGRINVAARLQHVERIAQLFGRLVSMLAQRQATQAAQALGGKVRRVVTREGAKNLRARRADVA